MDAAQRRKRHGILPAADQSGRRAWQSGGDLIAAILLAAGGSRRFGCQNKLLAPLGGRGSGTFLDRALAALAVAPVQRRIVVTGADRQKVGARARARLHDALIVHNVAWASGMASSVTAGLAALRPVDRVVIVMLADVTAGPGASIRPLLRALYHGAWAARPGTRMQPGHPVALRRAALGGIRARGNDGLWRAIADIAPDHVRWLRDVPAVGTDIDTQAALRRWRRSAREPRRAVRV